MDAALLSFRSALCRAVRDFFDERGYLEVDTPLLAPDLIPESCLEVFETRRLAPRGSSGAERPYWLIPSPEIWMKKLIAKHRRSLYQICHCFRNGESSGRFHSPEFSMLEYYTMDADWRDSIGITEELFARLPAAPGAPALPSAGNEGAAAAPWAAAPFERISVGEAFGRWAGFDLYEAAAVSGGLEAEARRLGLDPAPGLDGPALYDLIFVDQVEGALPKDHPVVLIDYPAFVPCLAKKSGDGKTVERWELYVRGIELANCYSEETDPQAVREFFEREKAAKERSALVSHGVNTDYWKLFLPNREGRPFPPCSGAALGLDRLMMLLTGRSTIDGVLPFPMV
ncbi:MAG: LysR family transcriptional regulator [Treponema sp.]|jgi:lysyl-tRNA synthetase class 2|nr:LysR family transcriptional regulator [Treponema sp.]